MYSSSGSTCGQGELVGLFSQHAQRSAAQHSTCPSSHNPRLPRHSPVPTWRG